MPVPTQRIRFMCGSHQLFSAATVSPDTDLTCRAADAHARAHGKNTLTHPHRLLKNKNRNKQTNKQMHTPTQSRLAVIKKQWSSVEQREAIRGEREVGIVHACSLKASTNYLSMTRKRKT